MAEKALQQELQAAGVDRKWVGLEASRPRSVTYFL